MQTINITVHTDDSSQIEAIKAVFKAIKVKFEISKEKPYNPEFVQKIAKSKKQIEQGLFSDVNQDNLKSFIDGL